MTSARKKFKAWVWVYLLRWWWRAEPYQDCPMCGKLLSWYDDCGWLHTALGDADCYGALGHGKGNGPGLFAGPRR